MAVVRQGGPTIVVAVFENIDGVLGTNHKHINSHFKTPATTHHGHTSWVTAPLFDTRVLPKKAKVLVVRQGEPTIVVAVFENIARVN